MSRPHHSSEEPVDSTPPIKVSRTTKVQAPIYIIVGTLAVTAAAVLGYADLVSTDFKHGSSIQELQAQTAKHEDRILKLEQAQTKIEVMQNDISWIRKSIEAQRNNMPATDRNPGGH